MDVVIKYNQALPSLEARKYLTGFMLNQMDSIVEKHSNTDVEEGLLSNKMTDHDIQNIKVEKVSDGYVLLIVPDSKYGNGIRLYFEVIKVNNEWKIRHRLRSNDDLEKSRKKTAFDN